MDIEAAHKFSSNHRTQVEASTQCGCFYCLSIFPPDLIDDWTDWPPNTPAERELELGTTALCPHCGIDSIIGSQSGYPITPEFLAKMKTYWFDS